MKCLHTMSSRRQRAGRCTSQLFSKVPVREVQISAEMRLDDEVTTLLLISQGSQRTNDFDSKVSRPDIELRGKSVLHSLNHSD